MIPTTPPSDELPDPAPAAPDRAARHWYLRLVRTYLGRGPFLDVAGAGGAVLAALARLGPVSGLAGSAGEAAAMRAGAPGCPVQLRVADLPARVPSLTAVEVLDRTPDSALDEDTGPGGWFRALAPGGHALVVAADAEGRGRDLAGARWPAPPVPRGHVRIREILTGAGFEIVREGSDGLTRGPYGGVPVLLDPRTAPARAQRSSGRLTLAAGTGERAVLVVRRPR
ncbi:hypothetical protein [Pseudonocardia sp. HH130630-07]|uniref:hypothetical protein n=1 Tax=Pseudonocardia sp. HH130630-07 TaxID=1690815 RepID=UPI0008152F2A|nr:hypothetical protein [Pseudonocardia sp. HH130630-07]ANY06616.1 hypothetical protein AFB00_10285 [Pseudonocardia sp. HH130630-07]